MIIDQHTDLYGVLGRPTGHSLSPVMHNAAFQATGINAVYLAFEVEDMERALYGIKALGIKGLSVTIPFKTRILPYLDEVDFIAEKMGAVNTVVNVNGCMAGYNTDGVGALKALEQEIQVSGKSCTLLGAGGAARAIGSLLREKGVSITVVNRPSGRGEELARSLECPYIPFEKIGKRKADILINTTPVGMYPQVDQCPVPEHVLEQGMVVMDIIYNPLETRLLRIAKARGCTAISGIQMFLHQGAEQFRLWTSIDPPLGVMSHAVNEALKQDERD